jgi:hypothetical protein
MRRELDYIADDPAALRWALGCAMASYRARLTCRPRRKLSARQAAIGVALMLLVGVAIGDRAGGQTAARPPTVHEPSCERPSAPTAVHANDIAARRDIGNARNDRPQSECDPMTKTPDTPARR